MPAAGAALKRPKKKKKLHEVSHKCAGVGQVHTEDGAGLWGFLEEGRKEEGKCWGAVPGKGLGSAPGGQEGRAGWGVSLPPHRPRGR